MIEMDKATQEQFNKWKKKVNTTIKDANKALDAAEVEAENIQEGKGSKKTFEELTRGAKKHYLTLLKEMQLAKQAMNRPDKLAAGVPRPWGQKVNVPLLHPFVDNQVEYLEEPLRIIKERLEQLNVNLD